MKNIILFDNQAWESLRPLTFYRPISEIRIGILTIKEKWAYWIPATISNFTQDYLNRKYPTTIEKDNILIAANILPTKELVASIEQLEPMHGLTHKGSLIAANIPGEFIPPSLEIPENDLKLTALEEVDDFFFPSDIFLKNGSQIELDFELITKGRKSQPFPAQTRIIGNNPIFIEEGASILAASINTTDGPVYIGKDVKIMEGVMIRGAAAFCADSVIKMGAKIYKNTTIGPRCTIGGEVNNCVFFGFSNKGHDGYLGNSVVAEWCNLGADTNCSNLKNNYSPIRIWEYSNMDYRQTDLIFHGLIMGDHSKCGINTMLNTGTIVGVNANLAIPGFSEKFIPSFTWSTSEKKSTYDISKAILTAERVQARRSIELSKTDHSIMEHIFRMTHDFRKSFITGEDS